MRWVFGLSLVMVVCVGACGGNTRGSLPPDGGSGTGGSGTGGSGTGGSSTGGSGTGGSSTGGSGTGGSGTGDFATCEQYANLVNKVTQNTSGPCANCVINAQGSACQSAASTADTACSPDNCQSCGSDGGTLVPAATCSCYQSCASAGCWSASIDLMQCILDQCSSKC